MTFQEMEQAMKEVKENLLVQSHFLDRLDRSIEVSRRDFDQRMGVLEQRMDAMTGIAENHDQRLKTIQDVLFSVAERQEALTENAKEQDDHLRETQAALQSLIKNIDRYISRGPNGHGEGGPK